MSQIVLNENHFSPEIREVASPASCVRERTQVHTADPAYDFYDELTEPMWNPPLLQPLYADAGYAAPNAEVEIEVPENEVELGAVAPFCPPTLRLSIWQRWGSVLASGFRRLLPTAQRTAL